MNFLRRLGESANDHANAIMVKELRQSVQSRMIVALLLLFLAVNVLMICSYFAWIADVQASERAGRDMFYTLMSFLTGTCMFFVPAYVAIRLSVERNQANIDLLFITTLSPGRIIRGKFWAGIALTGLLYSACLPFLTVTYLLRGIELPAIFFSLGAAFLVTAVLIMIGIFVGSVSGGWLLRIFLGGMLFQSAIFAMSIVMGIAVSAVDFGLASMFDDAESWFAFALCLVQGTIVLVFFYLLAVASISAPTANRMMPTRLFLTGCWLFYGGVAAVTSTWQATLWPFLAWGVGSITAFCILLPLMLSEREDWSPRVRREIPRAFLPRCAAWLFYTGSAGGVLWCVLLGGITLFVGHLLIQLQETTSIFTFARFGDFDEAFQWATIAFLYSWCYTMSGLFVKRMLLPRGASTAGTVISFVLVGLVAVVPLLGAYFVRGANYRVESLPLAYVIANPMAMIARLGREWELWGTTMSFLIAWGFLGFAVNFPWFRQQWERFRRFESKGGVPAEVSSEEPAVAHV